MIQHLEDLRDTVCSSLATSSLLDLARHLSPPFYVSCPSRLIFCIFVQPLRATPVDDLFCSIGTGTHLHVKNRTSAGIE